MKNFTKQFLNKTLYKSTRWLLIAFMFLLGTGGVWAQSWYTLSSDAYFYFNDNVSWTSSTQKAVLLIGRKWNYDNQGVGSNAYSMTNISNTKLQYYMVSAWGSGNEGKYTDIAILSGKSSDGWSGWEGKAVSNRRTYGSKYSAVRNDNISGKTAYYVGTTGANNDPLTFTTYSGYANIPTYTATLAVQTRPGTSGAYSTITSNAPATLKLQGTILSDHGTSSRTSGNAASVTWPTTKTRTAVVTGLVTVSYSSLSAGYTFDGWYEGSTQRSTATSYSYNQSANTTITAKFTAKQFTITYKDQGNIAFTGTHENGYPTTHTYGTATTLKSATKNGYIFEGWFTDPNCTTEVTSLEATAYTSDITLYAKWKQDKPTYTISYDVNGGTGTIASETKIEDEALTLTTSKPTRTGYTFQNWNTKADGTGTTYVSGAQYTANAAATLYAQWTANQYDIIYKDQGNVAFSGTHATGNPTTHTYGTATALKTATKSGYNFLGWFTKSDCSGTAVASLGATAYSANITLYAKWECAKSATAGEGSFSNGTITLSATFNTCGNAYIGFQWKKQGDEWCYTNDGKETCYKALGQKNISNAVEETSFTTLNGQTLSGTYVFRPYIVVGNAPAEWLYGEAFTVTACITVETPDIDPVAICAGSTATLTLKNKQNDVIYKIGDTPIFTGGTTHTVNPDRTTTYTITATSTNSCDAGQKETATVTVTVNAMPSLSPSATVTSICEGEPKEIRINTNATSIKWYRNDELIENQTTKTLTISTAGTYKVVVSNASGCSKEMSFTVANAFGSDITPTITGSASVQSGSTGINYSTANVDGATYEWQLPEGWTISSGKDASKITVAVPSTVGNGTVTVKITNNECTKTASLDVAWMKGFTVYLRRPHAKDETTQYNHWFAKSAAAGPGYIKLGTVKADPTKDEIYTYNGGSDAATAGELGTRGTESFTDCDGYVWDVYSIGIDVTALYFHAPNDKPNDTNVYGGYSTYTRSYSQTSPIAENLYFTIGDWTANNQKGRPLNKVDRPFEGIEIDALGDTEICSNNMASFAALYLSSNCTGKSVMLDAEKKPIGYAWKYSTDNQNWGDYTTGKGANSNNIRPNVAGYYRLECTLEDGSKVESNSIHITTKNCTITNTSLNNITSNLPIIMVQTGDKDFPSVSGDTHCSASADELKKKRSVDVKILWNQTENGTVSSTDAYSNGENLYYDRKARMNYRGSSSLNFEKKSYAFCPGDENCGQDKDKSADYVKTKKMNMFDLSGGVKDKDWVLYAAYVDPSMMRNILAMETYSAMTGKWGVDNQYVELYIDGEYQGVYIFMDKVTQNTGDSEKQIPGRVDVKWDVKDDTKRDFILKFDKTDAADRYEDASGDQKTFESDMTGKTGISTYDTEVDQRFEIEYPEKEDIEDDGGYWSDVYSFVLGKVNEFESALSKGDFTTVRNLINYESWADFFILNEFTKNVDAYRASCVFVYTDGKFEAWPLWDYELSFNNTVTGSGKGRGETTGLLIEHSDVYSDEFPAPFWWTGKYNGSNMYSGLLKDPCFLQKIKERWAEHTKAGRPLNPSITTAKTAAYKAILDAQGAATREFTKWPVTSRGKDACNNVNTGYFQYGGGGANTTYTDSYDELNSWLGANARIKGLQTEIDNLAKIIEFGITSTVDKDETTPWRAVNVKVDAVGADYTYTVTPEIIEGQVIQGSDNLLIYAEPATLPQTYTVVTTLNAKDQCGGKDADNASSTVTFTVNDLVENCEE